MRKGKYGYVYFGKSKYLILTKPEYDERLKKVFCLAVNANYRPSNDCLKLVQLYSLDFGNEFPWIPATGFDNPITAKHIGAIKCDALKEYGITEN